MAARQATQAPLPSHRVPPTEHAVPAAVGLFTGAPFSQRSSVHGLPSSTGLHIDPPVPLALALEEAELVEPPAPPVPLALDDTEAVAPPAPPEPPSPPTPVDDVVEAPPVPPVDDVDDVVDCPPVPPAPEIWLRSTVVMSSHPIEPAHNPRNNTPSLAALLMKKPLTLDLSLHAGESSVPRSYLAVNGQGRLILGSCHALRG